MLRRLIVPVVASATVIGILAAPSASAQDQTVNFFVGAFVPRGIQDRGVDDVLYSDYYLNPGGFLVFDRRGFNGATAGGEYLAGLGDFFDAGFSVGIYSRSVPSVDADFTYPNGDDVRADLRLRVIPITATVRYLPLGHHDAIEPYIGGGVGILRWRYSETGDFANDTDPNNVFIYSGEFTGTGTTVGPVILGGVRVPIGMARIGGEVRYQGGSGDLPADQQFAGPKINLGGFNYLFTIGVRF